MEDETKENTRPNTPIRSITPARPNTPSRSITPTRPVTPTRDEITSTQKANPEFVDKLTLELLMNKNHYQRYMSQTNPKRYAEIREYHENIDKFRARIENITEDLLNNPDKQITTDVNEAFENYMKTLITYFQMKQLESSSSGGGSGYEGGDDMDDDVLFSKMEDTPVTYSKSEENTKSSKISKSFWSKETVVKRADAFMLSGKKYR